jgi:hypothetical protein
MNSDMLLFGFVFAIFIYVGGYKTIAVVLAIAVVIFAILRGIPAKVSRAAGHDMLEPIVIESTRGPAYKVPSTMNFMVHPTSKGQSWYQKVTRMGIPGVVARKSARALRRTEE